MVVLRTDSDLEAIALDYFPDSKRAFSSGMERGQKVDILIQRETAERVLVALLIGRRRQVNAVVLSVCPSDAEFESMVHGAFPAVSRCLCRKHASAISPGRLGGIVLADISQLSL